MQNLHSFANVKHEKAFARHNNHLQQRWLNLPDYSESHNRPALSFHSAGVPRMASHIWHKQNAVKEKDQNFTAGKTIFPSPGKNMAKNCSSIQDT